jgi:hypothetical protein
VSWKFEVYDRNPESGRGRLVDENGRHVVGDIGAEDAAIIIGSMETAAALTAEIQAHIDQIPAEYRVRVREGGGPENLAATLAVSLAKYHEALLRAFDAKPGHVRLPDGRELPYQTLADGNGEMYLLVNCTRGSARIRALAPWADDVPLMGEGVPKDTGQIDWLIQYLLTVYKRFGNTAVVVDRLRWGACALHARSEAPEVIAVESGQMSDSPEIQIVVPPGNQPLTVYREGVPPVVLQPGESCPAVPPVAPASQTQADPGAPPKS